MLTSPANLISRPVQVRRTYDLFGWTQHTIAEPCSWDLVGCALARGWYCAAQLISQTDMRMPQAAGDASCTAMRVAALQP